MTTDTTAYSAPTGFRTRDIVLLVLVFTFALAVIGITGYFRLSTETDILRQTVLSALNGKCNKIVAIRVGFFTTGLVKAGSQFFKLPSEARYGLDSIRGGEVGVYKLQGTANGLDTGALLARADKALLARRWERVVGVAREKELVAVYVPHGGISASKVKCCVLVFNGENLVVAGVTANPEPLLALAAEHVDLKDATRNFALR